METTKQWKVPIFIDEHDGSTTARGLTRHGRGARRVRSRGGAL